MKFRERYIDGSTCNDTCLVPTGGGTRYGLVNDADVGFSNYNTLANSSSLYWTILSANNFLLGVFGGLQRQKEDYLAIEVLCVDVGECMIFLLL